MDSASLDFLICKACGTQYEVTQESNKDECRICDDPRQFVPPTGQEFTTLRELRQGSYKNVIEPDEYDGNVFHIFTEPKFGIGQRAILIRTGEGNILWDCVAYLDSDTVEKINSLGGIQQMVISHPHFYTTHLEWAAAFACPVYTSSEDAIWLNRSDPSGRRIHIESTTQSFIGNATAIKAGGHFDGSLLLHWKDHLFTADTIFTVQAAQNPKIKTRNVPSYAFLYSIPNFMPLPPDKIIKIWKAIEPYEFANTYGVMRVHTVRGPDLKTRILDSARIQIRAEGYTDHPFLTEAV